MDNTPAVTQFTLNSPPAVGRCTVSCRQQACSEQGLAMQAERRHAAEAAAETEAAAHAEASRLVLEKQLQQESDLQQVIALQTYLAYTHLVCATPDLLRLYLPGLCKACLQVVDNRPRKGLCLCCQDHYSQSNHWPLLG